MSQPKMPSNVGLNARIPPLRAPSPAANRMHKAPETSVFKKVNLHKLR